MKNKAIILVLLCGLLLAVVGSCSNGSEPSSNSGLQMDSASMAKKAKDESTLSTLKDKKQTAERRATEAKSNAKEAKRLERDATEAAELADEAFSTEEDAQRSRQQADDQAKEADKASKKADQN